MKLTHFKKEEFINWCKANEFKVFIFVAIFLAALQLLYVVKEDNPIETAQDYLEVDTFIPEGHSLIPLELINKKSMASILGAYGVVDLYLYVNDQYKKLMAENVKIFRAPHNPELFYILVPNQNVNLFIKENDKVYAVIKNRNSLQSNIKTNKPSTRRITLGVAK